MTSGCALLARRLVRGVEAVEDAEEDGRRDRAPGPRRFFRRAAVSRRDSVSPCTYSITRKSSPSCDDDVERLHHVRVLDARGEARLVEEHRRELGVVREVRVEPLDGDRPREPGGPLMRPKCTVAMPPDAITSKRV